MPTSIPSYLHDRPDQPVSIEVLRAWWPVRTTLVAMGCPNRPPQLLSDGALGWDDANHDDLPSCLPAALTGARISIIGAASDGAIHYLLHAYQAAAQVIVPELSEGTGGRALVAWICVDQRAAAWVAGAQAQMWGGCIGLDVSLTMAGTPDGDDVAVLERRQRAA